MIRRILITLSLIGLGLSISSCNAAGFIPTEFQPLLELDVMAAITVRKLILIALIIILTIVLIWISQELLSRLAELDQTPHWLEVVLLTLIPILRLVFLILAILVGSSLVISSGNENGIAAVILAVSGSIAFAFKDYAAGIIAGIITLREQPYRQNDWISFDGHYGQVQKIGLWAVHIRTPDDTEVIVPHSKVWTTSIANANSGAHTHMCVADLYVSPMHDAQLARQKLWDVCMTSPYTRLDYPVAVIVLEKPWGTHYRLKAYPIRGEDEFQFISDLTVRSKDALTKLGIEQTVVPAMPMS